MQTTLITAEPGPEAAASLGELVAAAEAADGQSPISDQARVAALRGDRGLRWLRSGGETVGLAVLGEGELDLVVRPEHRGRGHATRALAALLAEEPGPLLAWAHGDRPAADRLLGGAGFRPVRTLLRLALDPARLPDAAGPAPAPPGFAFAAFTPADAAEWLRVNALAFASHPEQGRLGPDDLAALTAEPWFDAADFLLAHREGGGLAGFSWQKVVRGADGAVAGEIYAIGVDPAESGRGLGRALMTAALTRLAGHAPDSVTLYVEGENAPALGLYRSLGFETASVSRQWRRDASPDVHPRGDALG